MGNAISRPGVAAAIRAQVRLEPTAGRLRARLYEWKVVRHERVTRRGAWDIDVILRPDMLGYLQRQPDCRVIIAGSAGEREETCGEPDGTLQSATV
jgi:hypothetical protein